MAKQENVMGSWAFLIGVIIAVVVGLLGSLSQGIVWLLVIIGLIVGLLNITSSEVRPFLLASVALVIAAALSGDIFDKVQPLGTILDSILALIVPSTIIVALKEVFSIAKR